ncbi:TniQ family protein [Ruminiclostridium cellobioparum]|uniref:TniQ domain-containing protein n=1 Tax=Ruminiclostridium cellobioparum subsp. termitidis CT1112 TaxID=1195236 RepID=S0FN22_RUMCE|nr:TniQ family protein [Ruminiclostridium cellobioparum]EMS70529.1 hypothetical protein CTER_3723 [Ruminiclostridium cellobioparum subsp. termitidis CT1112]
MHNEFYNIYNISHLYNLKPIGIGTPYVESLTSYIKRLAEAHSVSVGTLIRKELIPDMGRDYLMITHFARGNAMKINAMQSDVSDCIVRILGKKTCNYSLRHLTMSAWKECFESRSTFRKNNAWCPFCFEESLKSNEPLYEQLIWTFRDVDICGKHQTPLIQRCPYCNELNIFISQSRVGYCSKCNYWLGLSGYENGKIPLVNDEWHTWSYDNIGQLLAVLPILKGANLLQFRKNIGGLNISMKRICNEINVTYGLPYKWAEVKPCLSDVLRLSFKVGYFVYELLTQDIETFTDLFLNRKIIMKNKSFRNKTDIKELKRDLDEAISKNGVSLTKLSNQVNIKNATIKKYFPKEVEILKENYNNYLKVQKKEKLSLIKNTMKLLLHKGVFPSKNAIKYELGKDIVRCEEEIRVWKETLEELGCTKEGYSI